MFLWDQRSKRGSDRSRRSPNSSSTRLSSIEVFHLGDYGVHTLVGVNKLVCYDKLLHMLSSANPLVF